MLGAALAGAQTSPLRDQIAQHERQLAQARTANQLTNQVTELIRLATCTGKRDRPKRRWTIAILPCKSSSVPEAAPAKR
jgi:hypothetical protein